MTKDQIQSLIASYISKHAEEGAAHEAGETPDAEMLEHAMGANLGGGAEEAPHAGGPGGVDVEHLLSQLSPEELQQLISQLSAGGHPGEGSPGAGMGAPGAGGEDVPGLSQDIESHLAQNPEAQVPGAPPEKMAALNFVKSAHYIEGFIKQALDYGLDTAQAVNMYDSALTTTVDSLRKEAADKNLFQKGVQQARIAGKKGLRAVKSVPAAARSAYNSASDKARGAYSSASEKARGAYSSASEKARELGSRAKGHYENAALTAAEHPGKTLAAAGGALAAAGGAGYLAGKSSDKEKEAAYFEGVFKQAMAYGFSEEEAYNIVKEAADKNLFQKGVQQARIAGKKGLRAVKSVPAAARSAYNSASDKARAKGTELKNKAEGAWNKGVNKAYTNPGKTLGAAAGVVGLAGGAGYLAGKSSDKEKKAAYLEGVFKQAMAYGFSEAEAVQFAQQAEASL